MNLLSALGNFLAGLGRPQQQPKVTDQSRMAAANVGRGFGYGNSNSTQPYSAPMAQPAPQSLDLHNPNHYTPQITPVPSLPVATIQQLPHATAQVAKGIGKGIGTLGDMVLGGPAHLADVISYPAQEAIWRGMMQKGQISPQVYLQLTNQAAGKAGFQMQDKGGTVLRKTAGAVAGPTATILTAGAAPAAVNGLKAIPLASQIGRGALTGAGYGAMYGGFNALEQNQFTPQTVAQNVAQGAGAGALLGGAAPLAARGIKLANQGFSALGERGSISGSPTTEEIAAFKSAKDFMKAHPDIKEFMGSAGMTKMWQDAKKMGPRPGNQYAIEQAMKAGNMKEAQRLFDALPANDPYKASMAGSSLAPNGVATKAVPESLNTNMAAKVYAKQNGLAEPKPAPLASSQQGKSAMDAFSALKSEAGSIDPNAKLGNAEGKQRGFTTSVKQSGEVSPGTQALVKETYVPKKNADLVAEAERTLANRNGGLKAATNSVNESLNKPAGKITDQEVANAIAVGKAHDAKGNFEEAARIYDNLAQHLTEQGRAVQAASLLSRRTPQGLLYSAQKTLKKAGVEMTPELQAQLKSGLDAVKAAKAGDEKLYATQAFMKTVADNIPSSRVDKLVGIWKAGLLTGWRTQTGNAVSNVANASLKKASDPIAAGIDKAFSLFTGERTKTFTLKGEASGALEGVKAGAKYLKTGIDERNLENLKYDTKQLNYKNPILNTYVNGVFRIMSAADRPYYYAALRNSLADVGKAQGINQGLKGKALSEFVDNFMKNPPDEAANIAINDAEKSVFANKTLLSDLASGLRNGVSKYPAGKAAVNVIAPFTKVPSSVITQVFDYTPVGAVKEIVGQMVRHSFDQRQLSEALAKPVVGTLGAISTGVALTNAGLLTGAYPKDPKEQAAWKAEGKQPNSILIGGKWRSLNYVSPFGPLLGMGNSIAEATKEGQGALGQLSAAVAGGAQTALGQSFLQGVQGVLDAVNDPGRYGEKTARNMISSVVPTLVGDFAKATDPLQRTANSALEAIQAKIPFARQNLMPSTDAFGNQLERPTSAAGTMLDPLRSSTYNTNPLFQELDRLQSVKQGVFPTPDKTIQVGAQQVQLNPQQAADYNNRVGQQVQTLWNNLIQTDTYQNLPDDKKKTALQNIMDDVRTLEKRYALMQMGQGDLAGKIKLTQRQIDLGQGHIDPESYGTTQANRGIKLSGASKYQQAVSKFQQDMAAGKLSPTQAYAAQQSLAKLSITSRYPDDVVTLYNMNAANREAAMKDPKIAALLPQVEALAHDLYNTGHARTATLSKPKGTTKKGKAVKLSVKLSAAPRLRSAPRPKLAGVKLKKPTLAKAATKSIKLTA